MNAEKPLTFQLGIQKPAMRVAHGRRLIIPQNTDHKYWVKLKPSLMYSLSMKIVKCSSVIVAVEVPGRNKLFGTDSCKCRCMRSSLLALRDAFELHRTDACSNLRLLLIIIII